MTKTEHYNLSQWDASDPIRREDFNADNAAIDAAIKAVQTAAEDGQSTLETLIAAKGNCKIAYGSYTGTGTFGKSNPNTLTFDFYPIVVLVGEQKNAGEIVGPMVRGQTETQTGSATNNIEWSDNGVSWYYGSSYGESHQLNEEGTVYIYAAIGV